MDKTIEKLKIDPYVLLIVSGWGYNGFIYYINTVIRLMCNSIIANISTIIYFVLLFVLSFKRFSRNLRGRDLLIYPLFFAIVCVSYIFNVQNRVNISSHILDLFFLVIPCYFLGLNIDASEKTMIALFEMSKLVIIVNWCYVFVILGTGREMQSDNLAIAYMVLPHTLMAIWFMLRSKTIKNIFFSVIGCVFIFLMGSRGPLLSIVVFFSIWVLFKSINSSIWKKMTLLLSIVLIVLFINSEYFYFFLEFLRDKAAALNMSTRIVDSVLYGAADGSNRERMIIYGIMWSYIKKNPFLGYGIYGEWMMINYSAHNMLLELFTHYGVVVGSFLAFLLLGKIIVTVRQTSNIYARGFILVMFCFGIVRGIYAGTYLSDYFFLLIGFLVGQGRIIRQERRLSL